MRVMFYMAMLMFVDLLLAQPCFAYLTVGSIGSQATKSMQGLSYMINAAALVIGMGFAVGAVFKFKQHKDNPTQIPVGTPVALIFIAAGLLFLPSVFGSLGETLFGGSQEANTVTGKNSWVKSTGS